MTLPVIGEAASVISALHSAQFPANNYYNNWNSCFTPSATPVIPVLPPPIVIAPCESEFAPGIPVVDPLSGLPQLAATDDRVEAPAVAMTTEMLGRIPRPITGRGCRDQLSVTAAADAMVCLCLFLPY